MIRLGMLGSDGGMDGGHAKNVCEIINTGNYDAKIIGIFGTRREESLALAEAYGIDTVAERAEDLLTIADAVMVMHRNGNYHLENVLPFIKAGLPVFIDKPFTCTVADAVRIKEEAEKSGSIICGGTSVKYAAELLELKKTVEKKRNEGKKILSGYISFPVILDSEHGGIHFYSHHLIEEVLTVFGEGVLSVTSVLTGDNLVVIAKYPDFPVIMNYASNYGGVPCDGLHAGAYFEDDTAVMKQLHIWGFDAYQCEYFLDAVRTGKGESAEYYVQTVKISNAVLKSIEEKREVLLSEV